jgi:hypothetical protein
MEIGYRCERCEKKVTARIYLAKFKSWEGKGKDHVRMDCKECGKYIKFIGKNELSNMGIDIMDLVKKKVPKHPDTGITLKDINFKLDLIIDHLGIKSI